MSRSAANTALTMALALCAMGAIATAGGEKTESHKRTPNFARDTGRIELWNDCLPMLVTTYVDEDLADRAESLKERLSSMVRSRLGRADLYDHPKTEVELLELFVHPSEPVTGIGLSILDTRIHALSRDEVTAYRYDVTFHVPVLRPGAMPDHSKLLAGWRRGGMGLMDNRAEDPASELETAIERSVDEFVEDYEYVNAEACDKRRRERGW